MTTANATFIARFCGTVHQLPCPHMLSPSSQTSHSPTAQPSRAAPHLSRCHVDSDSFFASQPSTQVTHKTMWLSCPINATDRNQPHEFSILASREVARSDCLIVHTVVGRMDPPDSIGSQHPATVRGRTHFTRPDNFGFTAQTKLSHASTGLP